MDRRTFMSWVGLGWVASCLPVALAACSSGDSATTSAPSPATTATMSADGFQTVGTVADLDKNGRIMVEGFAGGDAMIIRDPANSQTLIAVNPTCTHKGCTVEWHAEKKEFACPCHDADFGPDGRVLEGPATAPLPLYTAKIEGDAVMVKA